MKRKLLFLAICIFSLKTFAQLAAGDIAVIGLNTDGPSTNTDEISIVTLAAIPSGTTIYFSDYYWDNTNSRWGNDGLNGTTANATEGIIKWTTTSAIAAGTVFKILWTMGSGTPSVSGLPGTVTLFGQTGTTTLGPLGQYGDNIFIYQSNNDGVTPSNWIFGWTNALASSVSANKAWQSSNSPISGTHSMLPTALTNGVNAISFAQIGTATDSNPSFDNNIYNIGSLRSGTKAAVLSAICTTANWIGNETSAYDISPTSTYFTGGNAFSIGNLGTNEFDIENNKLIIYPNPTSNYLTIQNKENVINNFAYNIVNVSGRIIKSGLSKYNEQINIESLTNGNYIVQIKTENGEILSKKLIKN